MDEVVDPFDVPGESLELKADEAEARKALAVRSQGREAAILRGRLLGEDTARLNRESGVAREQRVARAMRYAAWEFDGKPVGRGDEYHGEFAGTGPAVTVEVTDDGCVRAHLHHTNHAGRPCPVCGWPA